MSSKRQPAGSPDGGRFASSDAQRPEQGQLDFGDFEPERVGREGTEDDGRDITTDEYGVQHWPDGSEQAPMF